MEALITILYDLKCILDSASTKLFAGDDSHKKSICGITNFHTKSCKRKPKELSHHQRRVTTDDFLSTINTEVDMDRPKIIPWTTCEFWEPCSMGMIVRYQY